MDKSITIVGYSGHSFEIIKTLINNKFIIKGYLENEQKKYNPFSLNYLGNERDKNTSAIFKNEHFIIAIGSLCYQILIYYQISDLLTVCFLVHYTWSMCMWS